MRYRGDGSYTTSSGIKPEDSLLDLLEAESLLIGKLNEAQAAYVKAQRDGYGAGECSRIVENVRNKLQSTRESIREYFSTSLGLKVELLQEDNSGVVNLSRLGRKRNITENKSQVMNDDKPINLSRLRNRRREGSNG